MRVDFQILSNHSVDSYPCIAIISENGRILIDCGEGTQRLCIEHRIRLSKLECICLTRLNPQTMGGLPGLCLTAEGAGLKELKMFGPNNLNIFWDSLTNFMRPNLFEQLLINTASDEDIIIDNEGALQMHMIDDITLIPVVIDASRVCYLIKTCEIPGAFDVTAALALGVPKGPLFGQLKKGNCVTLENGNTVQPEQVLGPSDLGAYLGIICDVSKDTFSNCNSGDSSSDDSCRNMKDHQRIQEVLMNHPLLSRFHSTGVMANRLQVLIHLSDETQMNDVDYTRWCLQFGSETKHIWCGKGYSRNIDDNSRSVTSSSSSLSSSFIAAAIYADKLHSICPSVFNKVATSLPYEQRRGDNKSSNSSSTHSPISYINAYGDSHTSYYIRGECLSQYTIAPSKKRGFVDKKVTAPSVNDTQKKSKKAKRSDTSKTFKSNVDTDFDTYTVDDDDNVNIELEWTEETLERLKEKEKLLTHLDH